MYQLRAPAPSLRRFIEHYWFVTHAPGETVHLRVDVFVDARADLIFNFGAPYVREVIGGEAQEHRRSNLDAQRLVPIRIIQEGAVHITGVRFRIGGLGPFVRGALDAWTNQTPEPAAVFGGEAEALELVLRGEPDLDAQARALDAFFTALLDTSDPFETFHRALTMLLDTNGAAAVQDIAAAVAVSTRKVERLFARYLGVPPKTAARVLRFQGALRALMTDPGCSLAAVADAAGYFDQAHFIKDFKRMSGGVPRGYRGYYPPAGPNEFAPNVVVFLQDRRSRSA